MTHVFFIYFKFHYVNYLIILNHPLCFELFLFPVAIFQVGSGNVIGDNRFLQFLIPAQKLHTINLMSVSTGPGSDGQWEFIEYLGKICKNFLLFETNTEFLCSNICFVYYCGRINILN